MASVILRKIKGDRKMAVSKKPVWITEESHRVLKKYVDTKNDTMLEVLSSLIIKEIKPKLRPQYKAKEGERDSYGGVWLV
jgi:hypothetical protein